MSALFIPNLPVILTSGAGQVQRGDITMCFVK